MTRIRVRESTRTTQEGRPVKTETEVGVKVHPRAKEY